MRLGLLFMWLLATHRESQVDRLGLVSLQDVVQLGQTVAVAVGVRCARLDDSTPAYVTPQAQRMLRAEHRRQYCPHYTASEPLPASVYIFSSRPPRPPTMAHAGIKSSYSSLWACLQACTQARIPAVILLSFVLAVGFLLVILSCALWANWLPLLVGACSVSRYPSSLAEGAQSQPSLSSSRPSRTPYSPAAEATTSQRNTMARGPLTLAASSLQRLS